MQEAEAEAEAWVNKLAKLTPSEIATFFEEEGIKGHRADPTMCPLSVFIKEKTGTEMLMCREIYAYRKELSPPHYEYYHTPAPIANFVSLFDAGLFKNLERHD
jgi:hypothetical protein